jgi:hypothetical protein
MRHAVGMVWDETTTAKRRIRVLRRLVTLASSFALVMALGIARVDLLLAQDVKKEAQPPAKPAATEKQSTPAKTDTAKTDTAKTDTKNDTTKKEEKAEPPLPPIPPEVMAKVEAARKAVAEAIVAAQDANLVDTSIDPPPVLDILIDARATDGRTLKNATAKKPYGLSPEVFGAWFTGYGKLDSVNYAEDVRIVPPSQGLKRMYDERARIFGQLIQDIRKAKGPVPTAKKAEEAAKPAPPKAEEKKK